jgi:transcriptional regulator NrdR family protein
MEQIQNRMERGRDNRSPYPIVDHRPATCPSCGSVRARTTTTRRPSDAVRKRWHSCKNCGGRYESLEEVPEVDRAVLAQYAARRAKGKAKEGKGK